MTPAQRRRQTRMRAAVEARAKGWSLRAIGAQLGVDHVTVRNDLRRWDDQRQVLKIAGEKSTPGVENPTPDVTSNVVQIRREAR